MKKAGHDASAVFSVGPSSGLQVGLDRRLRGRAGDLGVDGVARSRSRCGSSSEADAKSELVVALAGLEAVNQDMDEFIEQAYTSQHQKNPCKLISGLSVDWFGISVEACFWKHEVQEVQRWFDWEVGWTGHCQNRVG